MPYPTGSANSERFCVGQFVIDLRQRSLVFDGAVVRVPPKVFDCFALLVAARGNVVTKQEFFEAVWEGVFVGDSSLSYAISQLRKTLAEFDDAEYVSTVPKRGFRLVAPVSEMPAELVPTAEVKVQRTTIEDEWYEDADEPIHRHFLPAAPSGLLRWGIAAALILSIAVIGLSTWKWLRPAPGAPHSIAVLPVASFDGAADDEALRMRITDALITKLANLGTLSVRPTSSVAKLAGSGLSPLDIGRRLQVDAVLEGHVQHEGDRIRVTIQLVDVGSGEQIWADQFDGAADRLLDLQDAVSARLINRLDLRITSEERAEFERRPTQVQAAYEEYLRGRYLWNKRSDASLRSSIEAYRRALALDPNFAAAYVGLADSYYLLVDYSYDTSPGNVAMARENIDKALALDPRLADAYVTLGLIETGYEWNWNEAERSFRRAIELAPNSPNAHHRYAIMLSRLRRFSEAEAEMTRARQLDPTSTGINTNLGAIYFFAGQYGRAVEQFKNTVELDDRFSPPVWYLARTYWISGDKPEALRTYARASRLNSDESRAAMIENSIGRRPPEDVMAELARSWQQDISPTGFNAHDIAIAYAALGDEANSLHWLERSVEERHPWASAIYAEPEFDFLRSNERFNALLKKMGLPA